MSKDRDPPIEELGFIVGVKVVNIGDYRVSRGMTRRPFSGCPHRTMSYDTNERRIWCRDCERDVEPFDAFSGLCQEYHEAFAKLQKRFRELEEAEKFQIRSLAAKAIDKAWRKRNMVPACPHCRGGLFPEHFKDGCLTMLGRDYASTLLKRKDPQK